METVKIKGSMLTITVCLLFVLTACNNVELEATIEEQYDRIAELESQSEELSECIIENERLMSDIAELERQLGFWQKMTMEGINLEFLPYITIDEGYGLIGYFHQEEEQFDFHLYQLRWYLELEELPDGFTWERVEIVVVQNDEVLGVVSSDNWPPLVGEHGHQVIELPTPFGGYDGFLIPRITIGMFSFYELYFVQNGELIHIPEFAQITNPSFNFSHQELTSGQPLESGHWHIIYQLIDGEFVAVERNLIDMRVGATQIYVNGEWIEQVYDEVRWNRNFRDHWSESGLFYAY